jgi:hypothetical protein
MDDTEEGFHHTQAGGARTLACFWSQVWHACAWFYRKTALAAHYTARQRVQSRHIIDKSAALDYYERAIALDPNNPEPHTDRRFTAPGGLASNRKAIRPFDCPQAIGAPRHCLNPSQSDARENGGPRRHRIQTRRILFRHQEIRKRVPSSGVTLLSRSRRYQRRVCRVREIGSAELQPEGDRPPSSPSSEIVARRTGFESQPRPAGAGPRWRRRR